MLRQSPPRLFVAFTCALCLSLGALPAAALPVSEGSPASRFDAGSWLSLFWGWVGEPVVSLFAADGTGAPPPPPSSDAGATIDPSGAPGA